MKNIADVVNAQCGDTLPVSAFNEIVDGTIPAGTAAYEKRGIAVKVPEWNPDNCIQCNTCAFVCPHAAIRPFLMTAEEAAAAPAGIKKAQGKAVFKEYTFTMQVSPADCTGCGNCADVCPAKEKALVMVSAETQDHEQANFDYLHSHVGYKDTVQNKLHTTRPSHSFSVTT